MGKSNRIKRLGVKKHLHNAFHESSIHGVKFVAEENVHPIERSLWVALLVSAICAAGYVIFQTIRYYRETFNVIQTRSPNRCKEEGNSENFSIPTPQVPEKVNLFFHSNT